MAALTTSPRLERGDRLVPKQVVTGAAPASKRSPLYQGLVSVLFVLGALLFLAPLLIVLVTAIQPQSAIIQRGPAALPEQFTFSNFTQAWGQGDLGRYYLNSFLILVVKVPLGILLTSLAAYPLATIRFRSRKAFLVLLLIGLGVPQVITLYPLLTMVSHIGLGGTLWSLLLPYLAFGTPFEILVMRGAFAGIPRELFEAARVDGAPERYIWGRVCLPLVLPAIASLVILDGVATWNEFVIALALLSNQSSYTLPLGINSLQGEFTSSYPELEAGALVCIVPMIFLFFLTRRYLIRGMAAGAVKG
jgi:raffinose/stachyose/melibiose transport system permease protein